MRFDDEGIYDPKARESTVQLFDLRIVQAGPRGVRKHLWNYVFNKLKTTILPDNRVLYLETDSMSAWKFEGTKEFTRDLSTAHGHGESDPSLAFWVEYTCFHVKEGKTAVIRSKDGDCVPILLHAIEMQERYAPPHYARKPVYWMKNKDEVYDMRLYHEKIKSKYKFSISQYMIFCILCKTDFFEKNLICNGFGATKIFDAVDCMKEEFDIWDTPLHPGETQEERDKKELHALAVFVRQLYQNHFTGNVKGLLSVVRNKNNEGVSMKPALYSWERLQEMSDNKGGKAIKFPSLANLHKAYEQLSFNYRYWRDRTRWPKGMFGTMPQAQRSAKQFLMVGSSANNSSSSSSSSSSAAAAAASSSPASSSMPQGPKCTSCNLRATLSCVECADDYCREHADEVHDSKPYQNHKLKYIPWRPNTGGLKPKPRIMRTESQAALEDAEEERTQTLESSSLVSAIFDSITVSAAAAAAAAAGGQLKKPRVSAATVIAAAAADYAAASSSSVKFTDLDKYHAELEATKGELTPREHSLDGCTEVKDEEDDDEDEIQMWEVLPPSALSIANREKAEALVKELDEEAKRFASNLSPPPAVPTTTTRKGYFNMFQGIIHRPLGGTSRSGLKRKTP